MGLTYGEAVAEWLKAAMRMRGIESKDELARLSGLGRATVFDVASGDGLPTRKTLTRLAASLQIPEPRFEVSGEPTSALEWVESARSALGRAVDLMRPDAGGGQALTDNQTLRRAIGE